MTKLNNERIKQIDRERKVYDERKPIRLLDRYRNAWRKLATKGKVKLFWR